MPIDKSRLSHINKMAPENAITVYNAWLHDHINDRDELGRSMLDVCRLKGWINAATTILRFNYEQDDSVYLSETRGEGETLEESFAYLLDRKNSHHFTAADPDRIERTLKAIEDSKAKTPNFVEEIIKNIEQSDKQIAIDIDLAEISEKTASSYKSPLEIALSEAEAPQINLERDSLKKSSITMDLDNYYTSLDGSNLFKRVIPSLDCLNDKVTDQQYIENGDNLNQKNEKGQTLWQKKNFIDYSFSDNFLYSTKETLRAINRDRTDKLTEAPAISEKEIKKLNTALRSEERPDIRELRIAKLIVKNPAITSIRDVKGNTLTQYTISKSKAKITQLLIELGVDPLQKNDLGQNTKEYAEYADKTKNLITNSFRMEMANPTPKANLVLLVAVNDGDLTAVKDAISSGANIEMKNKAGKSIIKIAIEKNHIAIVEQLISAGVRLDNQILNVALNAGHREIAALISSVIQPEHREAITSIKKESAESLNKFSTKRTIVDIAKDDYKTIFEESKISAFNLEDGSESYLIKTRSIVVIDEESEIDYIRSDIEKSQPKKAKLAQTIDAMEDPQGNLVEYIKENAYSSIMKKVKAVRDINGKLFKVASEDDFITLYKMDVSRYENPILNHQKASEILKSAAKYKAASKLLDLGKDKALAEAILEEVDAQGADKAMEMIFSDNQPNSEDLFKAIDHNDINKVIELVSNNPALVNAIDADGSSSALSMANAYGHYDIASYLSINGAIAHEHIQEPKTLIDISFLQQNDPNNFDCLKDIHRLGQDSATDSLSGVHLGGLLTMLLLWHHS